MILQREYLDLSNFARLNYDEENMKSINRSITAIMALPLFCQTLASCHESLEERAARECKEFTERNCPRQLNGGVVYDSLTFDTPSRTFRHYYSVTGPSDDPRAFAGRTEELRKAELEGIRGDIASRKYKDAGYNFEITIRSQRNPKTVYFHTVFTSKELR